MSRASKTQRFSILNILYPSCFMYLSFSKLLNLLWWPHLWVESISINRFFAGIKKSITKGPI